MMAVNVSKSFFRVAACRGYATCQATPVGGMPDYEVQNGKLPNNLVVTSAENNSPISRISIVFRAGARNETSDNKGVTHTLRVCAGLSTKNTSQFAIMRNLQQVGASLSCTTDREIIAYTLEGTRAAIEKSLPFLTEVATQQVFRPWEVSDNVPRQRLELATRPPQLRAIDLFHKAAFREGLGNSLYSAKYRLGSISSETLQHYVKCNFTTARTAVIGLGVDHSQLTNYAQNLNLTSGGNPPKASPFVGGEIRSDKGGDFAFVAIGGEGCGLKNPKEALAFAVLQKALGAGPQIKWGWNDNGILTKAVGSGDRFSISAFNASYADTGVFGVFIAAPKDAAGKLVECAAHVLSYGKVTECDVNKGKNQLKTSILTKYESGSKAIGLIGTQAAILGCAQSVNQIVAEIDSITEEDVCAAQQKVSSSQITMASVGDLRTVPFLDQLE